LIGVNANFLSGLRMLERGGLPMPTETLAIVIAISAMFALFAGSLAWADFYSHGREKP
jgi:hypothetical protein